MKKILIWLIVGMFILSISFVGTACKGEAAPAEEAVEAEEAAPAEEAVEAEEAAPAEEPVTIVLSSWRTEDKPKIDEVNQIFMDQNPNILVKYDPVKRDEYEPRMLVDLEGGVGPDIITVYGLDRGRPVYDAGYLLPLNDWLEAEVPQVMDLPYGSKIGWMDDDGIIYAIPLLGVSHGFYYNKDVFDEYGFEEPETWAEFIDICDTLKADGKAAIACGSKDTMLPAWMGSNAYWPNIFGGEESRKKLAAGELKLTEEPFLSAFKAMDQLTQYYPEGAVALDYETCQNLFTTGQVPIFIGGSWEIGTWATLGYDFELGWFPGPLVNEGDQRSIVLYADQGWAINKETKHLEEVKEYLKWVAGPEFNKKFANALPGFFPFAQYEYEMDDPIAKEWIDVITDPSTEIISRWYEIKLSSQDPSARSLIAEISAKIISKEFTPEEAAAYMQESLEIWYEPFQN